MERRFPSCSWHKEAFPMRLGSVVTMAMGRSRRSQASQGASHGTGKAVSAALQAADRLWKAMSYEQSSGYLNSKGDYYFNEYLNKELVVLEQYSPEHLRRHVANIRQECQQYQEWTVRQRQDGLSRLHNTLSALWQKRAEENVWSQTQGAGRVSLKVPAPPGNQGQAFPYLRNGSGGSHRQANGADAPRAATKGQQQQEALLRQINMTRSRMPPAASKSMPPAQERPIPRAPPPPKPTAAPGPRPPPPNSPAVAPSSNGGFSWGWADTSSASLVEERGVNGAVSPFPAESGPEDVPAEKLAAVSLEDAGTPGRPTLDPHESCISLKRKVIVFDTETTDIRGRIIELGAYALESGESFATLVNPGSAKSSAPAFRTHGISDATVRAPGVPTFKEVGRSFLDFVERQLTAEGSVPVLVAHNLCNFDFGRMAEEFELAGLEWPPGWEFLDSLYLAKRTLPGMANYKQRDLADHFGVNRDGAHRALNDVITLAQVLQHMMPLTPGGHLDALMADSAFIMPPGGSSGTCGLIKDLQEARLASPAAPTRDSRKAKAQSRRRVLAAQHIPKPVTAEDPIEKVERAWRKRAGAPASNPSEPRAGAVLADLPTSWPEVLRVPAGQRPFLDQPLQASKAPFTPTQSKKMEAAELGFGRVLDVLQYYPRDYLEHTYELIEDQHVTLVGTVAKVKSHTSFKRGYMSRLEATLLVDPDALRPAESDPEHEMLPSGASGRLETVTYSKIVKGSFATHSIRGLVAKMPEGARVLARGRMSRDGGVWKLDQNATIEAFNPDQIPSEILPVYSQKQQMSPKDFQDAIGRALRAAKERTQEERDSWDCIPAHIRQEFDLMGWFEAIEQIHSPSSKGDLEDARYRLAFEENLLQQLPQLLLRELCRAPQQTGETAGVPLDNMDMLEAARSALPYQLTSGQDRALRQILEDVKGPAPMLRLLQGEVGCGKTVVAFLALLAAAGSGYQGALMAPTEVLVEQHHASFARLVERMPEGMRPTYSILTRSNKTAQRRELLADLAAGRLQILMGTHTLLSDSVEFPKLGLAITDEQHKFGVEQRAQLQAKGTVKPHVLAMTATPIPRTLSLVTQGEMAFTAIDEMPPGRRRVETAVLEDTPAELERVYAEVAAEVADGGRAFIIYPLIEESSAERLENIRAAEEEHGKLQASGRLGAGVSAGLLHGRLAAEEKQAAVQRFVSGETPVLVSTTLVEVGMDVPEASVMVVNHAERYGLAKLHQLRGRVGRGTRPAKCFLIASQGHSDRLTVLKDEHSGLQIAEIDLAHRGPGEVMGRQQSGRDMLACLKLTKLPQDHIVVEEARRTAAELVALYGLDPADWPPALLLSLARPDFPKLDHLALAGSSPPAEAPGGEAG